MTSGGIVEPPVVDIWRLPRDASGDPEVILAVHRDGGRFCYRYRLDGAEHIASPTLRVHRGERFALRIVNDIRSSAPGERASSKSLPPCKPPKMLPARPVAMTGYLGHLAYYRFMVTKPVDTNIHLHGFEGPASEENVFLSTLSTPMHACEYVVTVPRNQPPGTYFYHPHVHGMSAAEVFGGLSGVWIVEPDVSRVPLSDDHVLVVRDRVPYAAAYAFLPDASPLFVASAERERERSRHFVRPFAFDPFDPPPWPSSVPLRTAGVRLKWGACGGVFSEPLLTVDGSNAPGTLDVPVARTQVLHVVNATPDEVLRIRMQDGSGVSRPLEVVARDGVPISADPARPLSEYVREAFVDLPPAGRADVLVTVERGKMLRLYSDRNCLNPVIFTMRQDLVTLRPVEVPRSAPSRIASVRIDADSRVQRLLAYAHSHPRNIRKRAITFSEYLFAPKAGVAVHSAYYITDTTNRGFHEHPFAPMIGRGALVPTRADIVVKNGTIEEWYLINTTLESHAFHIHQMTFAQERDPSGVPTMLDTVVVPVGRLLPNPGDSLYPRIQPSITRVLLDFRHVPRGTFVFHCHMLSHEDRGMMGTIRVE